MFGCAGLGIPVINGTDWKLSVSDNGNSANAVEWPPAKVGLGTSIVGALAQQLDARVETVSNPAGTMVTITHSTFKSLSESRLSF